MHNEVSSARLGWLGFGAFVVLNAVWLYRDVRSDHSQRQHVEAYAECRNAVRRAREDAARVPFPTADLVRVSRPTPSHFSVRGFFDRRNQTPVWYRCELSHVTDHWRLDSLVFER